MSNPRGRGVSLCSFPLTDDGVGTAAPESEAVGRGEQRCLHTERQTRREEWTEPVTVGARCWPVVSSDSARRRSGRRPRIAQSKPGQAPTVVRTAQQETRQPASLAAPDATDHFPAREPRRYASWLISMTASVRHSSRVLLSRERSRNVRQKGGSIQLQINLGDGVVHTVLVSLR
jgi:hypothetical protein